MNHLRIGWDRSAPVPDGFTFNSFLSNRKGRLHLRELDLSRLIGAADPPPGLRQTLPSPLEIVFLPLIRQKIAALREAFARAIDETGYAGRFHYVYASKANAAEEVVRTVLQTGAHYEFSSWIDIEIARHMMVSGHLSKDQMVICNGFKPSGSRYSSELIRFQGEHGRVIPVLDDLSELPALQSAGVPIGVGLRQKCYGPQHDLASMQALNIRFGMQLEDIERAAGLIASSSHLSLVLYHAMVGGQITDIDEFIDRLRSPIEIYARLRQTNPDLRIFNYGGGLPVAMTLDFNFDYQAFASRLLSTLQQVCARHDVPVPDVMGEMGRYTVAEHGAHLFKVMAVKENGSGMPWYIIDGSIMSSFPDAWALGEHFTVLPLNHLDKPFQRVQLGGVTCDSDDVYPPKKSDAVLYLPVETQDLYIGFFSIGAYQEMLGGAGGSKHCVIPEADELIIDEDSAGGFLFEVLPGQESAQVLRNLGYGKNASSLAW